MYAISSGFSHTPEYTAKQWPINIHKMRNGRKIEISFKFMVFLSKMLWKLRRKSPDTSTKNLAYLAYVRIVRFFFTVFRPQFPSREMP